MSEMKNKWCPFARIRTQDGPYNRFFSENETVNYGHSLCLTHLCAMWVPVKGSTDENDGDCGLKSGVR